MLASCGAGEVLLEPFRGETPRERYEEALDRAGLGGSTMVRAWHLVGRRALLDAVEIVPPVVEEVWVPPEVPAAFGYLMEAERGQRIDVRIRTDDTISQIFLEIYRVRDPGDEESELLVEWADPWERSIAYDARATGRYLLRVQPELMAGGAVEVSVTVGPSLAFPVEGRSTANVLSFFGDIRAGGSRDHHGVDIFAPRGTPVRAATDGTVYRVEVTNLGGKVVWVRDRGGRQRQYFAHLDSQMVRNGQTVRAGDVLGLVGNTGNARTTSPHLHFGVYMRPGGAVDPYPFIHDPEGEPEPLTVSREAFQETLRVRAAGTTLLAAPSRRAARLADLPAELPVRVLGGAGQWYRVQLPGGEQGYAPGDALEPIEEPLGVETIPPRLVMRTAPVEGAPRIRGIENEEVVLVLGRSGSWILARAEGSGVQGWLPLSVE